MSHELFKAVNQQSLKLIKRFLEEDPNIQELLTTANYSPNPMVSPHVAARIITNLCEDFSLRHRDQWESKATSEQKRWFKGESPEEVLWKAIIYYIYS